MKKLWASGIGCATLFAVGQASAEEPFTAEKVSVAGAVTYGIFTGDGDLNPYGLGLGARGGYTLDNGLYIGGLFDYFFGESEEENAAGASADASVNVWLLQAEAGYDVGVAPNIVLRPKLGLGVTSVSAEVCGGFGGFGGCSDASETDFSLSPGIAVPIDLGGFYVAPEARYNIVFTGDDIDANGFLIGAGIGATF